MTTHVFIVGSQTFPLHLEYRFAGTGAGEKEEHIGLLADIKRVRPKDKVIFYLQGVGFYGVFRISESEPSVFKDPLYLQQGLGKKLIYRVIIEPDRVYPEYVTEWEALDKLPVYAQEVIWSLIYRKLRGNRGCTPITPEESERLIGMIKEKNKNKPLKLVSTDGLTWNKETWKIEKTPHFLKKYDLKYKKATFKILSAMQGRLESRRSYEPYLQAYFIENIGLDPKLDPICGGGSYIVWIGNEVACGVGMQKIDVLIITADERNNREFRLIELKDEIVSPQINDQLKRYIDWAHSYIKDAINSNIQPIVVAPEMLKDGRGAKRWEAAKAAFHSLNGARISKEVEYFEFKFHNKEIIFTKIKY